jgi:uncharacterized membrane protein
VALGLVGACTVVDKGDYTFTDNPDATGGEDSGGTGGAQGGSGNSSGTGGTAGEGGEDTGGSSGSGTGGSTGGTSGDGGGGTGGAGDGCDPNPCENDGACTVSGDSFTCRCAEGWEGETCSINTEDCEPDPCQNGGQCMDLVAGYVCMCPPSYTGIKCELPRFELITLTGTATNPRGYARAVSADGTVVLGAHVNVDGLWRPYFWSSGGMPLGVQGIPSNLRMANVRPNAISGNGLHWVGETDFPATPGDTQPIGGTATANTTFNMPTDAAYGALLDVDLNATQSVGYVEYTPPIGDRAFWWDTSGRPIQLDPPMVGSSMMDPQRFGAGAITRDASIIAGSLQDMGGSWWVVHWGQPGSSLPPPVAAESGTRDVRVHGVSANGQVVVGSYDSAVSSGLAFVTQATRFNIISPPPPSGGGMTPIPANAWDINDDGTIIVGDMQAMGGMGMAGRVAVVWQNQLPPMPVPVDLILRDLGVDLRGARLTIAYGVSADGKVVVGEVFDTSGVQHGFIARLP